MRTRSIRIGYTRNLVDAGNGRFNLMILCWGEGHASPIHDHSDSHCFMKMLKGELREIRYAWPTETDNNNEYGGEMVETARSIMETNSVRYINDTMGLHRVENPSMVDGAISLHLYCPPYNTCSIFHLKTSVKTKCTTTFYSKFGHRRFKDPEVSHTDQESSHGDSSDSS